MMKHGRLAVGVVVVVSVVFVFTGCAGDVDKARGYIEKADSLAPPESLAGETAGLIYPVLEAVAGGTLTGEMLSSEIGRIKEAVANQKTLAEEAKSEYRKVLELQDVEDYKEYANTRIQLIDNSFKIMEDTIAFLEDLAADLSAGQPLDDQAAMEFLEQMQALSEKGEELSNKADGLRDELGLP